MLHRIIACFLKNRGITLFILLLLVGWGWTTLPFGWHRSAFFSNQVAVDAIPNLGDNQQTVYTEWMGRSPSDVQAHITYPLTTFLLGLPGVQAVRGSSMFGVSSIYLVFDDSVDFYWSRARITEKLNTLPVHALPEGVTPALGPDATALGQVYAYTIVPDEAGNVAGGWDLHELRTVQDFYITYGLLAVQNVAEVASVGGYVQAYQINIHPPALQDYGITLQEVVEAVRAANQDVSAGTLDINKVEYVVRAIGRITCLADIESAIVGVRDGLPVRIQDLAEVSMAPLERRGLLDDAGKEVVGGIVTARYGSNPMAVIEDIKKKVAVLSAGLPTKTLADGSKSKLHIVPFYDRSQLIRESIATLSHALLLEMLITILVVVVMLQSIRTAFLVSSVLPVAVLLVFLVMRYTGTSANIVSLAGIAIAIGTMVDFGIVLAESIWVHSQRAPHKKLFKVVYEATCSVSGAILTAASTTLVSFLPVFTMEAEAGKLFRPLAFTKTILLVAALAIVLFVLPALSHWVFGSSLRKKDAKKYFGWCLLIVGVLLLFLGEGLVRSWGGITLCCLGISYLLPAYVKTQWGTLRHVPLTVTVFSLLFLLAKYWMPIEASLWHNVVFVMLVVGVVLLFFRYLLRYYPRLLVCCLRHRAAFFTAMGFFVLCGLVVWLGFAKTFGVVASGLKGVNLPIEQTLIWRGFSRSFPGLPKTFMPTLDEGSFLFMPSAAPHMGVTRNKEMIQHLDKQIARIPEVKRVVSKMGRAASALDPAPIGMYESLISYQPKYALDKAGYRGRFQVDDMHRFLLRNGAALSNEAVLKRGLGSEALIADPAGEYFRNWRSHIHTPDDIWEEVVAHTAYPGLTTAPKLHPIETRLLMLQSGTRAPISVKVMGMDIPAIEAFSSQLEMLLKEAPVVKAGSVFAERILAKPYLHMEVKRRVLAQYGLSVRQLQTFIQTAIGGTLATYTIENDRRLAIQVRYPRALRDHPAAIKNMTISTPLGGEVPLDVLVDVRYVLGPQVLRSEDTFLVKHILLEEASGSAGATVQALKSLIQEWIANGTLSLPDGVFYKFSGTYEQQERAQKRLAIILPLVLLIIFAILYVQFRSLRTACIIFSGVALSFAGGFLMLWLYNRIGAPHGDAPPTLFGIGVEAFFRARPVYMSVAVWVGFIALFGIATDNGVLMTTYIMRQLRFAHGNKLTVRKKIIQAATDRFRPALMTTATTILALLPVLSATGKGANLMIPMAIPLFGGMIANLLSCFMVPLLFCVSTERRIKKLPSYEM